MKKFVLSLLLVISCIALLGCNNQNDIQKNNDNVNEISNEKSIYTIDKKLLGEPLKNYIEEFKVIIDAVKEKYSYFREEDYLVFYINIDRMGSDYRTMTFVYAIDGYIRTNSSIGVDYENGEITLIGTSGVKIKDVDMNKINKDINNFETNKKELIEKKVPYLYKNEVMINDDYTLKNEGLSENVLEFEEFYRYDFNTEKLIYEIDITNAGPNNSEYVDAKEIEI